MSGPSVGGGGLGRYVEQLLKELPNVDKKNRYFSLQPPIPWYTLKEQLLLPRFIDRKKLDLVHFPHWNVPLTLKTPFVVTIHDLILLEEPRSARATTRHPFIYALKYLGFKRVLAHAIHASKKIIAVSETTKSDILKHFPDIHPEKIVVIYEGVTPLASPTSSASPTSFPFLLYVGNAYPHKNLSVLLEAFQLIHQRIPALHLIFAGRDDQFSRHLEQQAQKSRSASHFSFIRNPSDEQLGDLYRHAELYVFPSRIEGFGLPPLEAMRMGTPVACSDIPSLREILGEAACYFPPNDPKHIADTIVSLLNDQTRKQTLIQKGNEQIKRYNWTRMAEQTVRVYQACE